MKNKKQQKNSKSDALFVKNSKLVNADEDYDYKWEHIDLSVAKNAQNLNKNKDIPQYVKNALTSSETRPKAEVIGEGLLIILRGLNMNPDESEEDMISIRIWLTKHYIISTQFRDLQTTNDFLDRARAGNPEVNTSVLLAKIISSLFQKIEATVLELSDTVDTLEESLSESFDPDIRTQISTLRKKVVIFKRHLMPQREVMSQLRYSSLNWMNDEHRNYHNENYERVMRNIDELEEMRDKLNIVKEEVQYIISEKLNRNTYVLSMVTAIFLPLGFLTGLLGINVGGIPGADYEFAFWVFCSMLFVIAVLQVAIFRKLKWL